MFLLKRIGRSSFLVWRVFLSYLSGVAPDAAINNGRNLDIN